MQQTSSRPAEVILYAEDDPNDQFLAERVLKKINCPVQLLLVRDGAEALDYLQGKAQYTDRKLFPLPTIILLDIKMPRVTGFQVLEWVKNSEAFRRTPTVMLSSSSMQEDIDRAYDLGASIYLTKPSNSEEHQKLFRAICDLFVEHAEKPTPAAEANSAETKTQ